MKEFTPKPTEAFSFNSIEASLNSTISDRFKNLVPEKARAVAKAVSQRALLTVAGASLIIGAGCGNVRNLTDTEDVRVTIVKPSDDITVRVVPAESTAILTPTPTHETISTPTPPDPNPTETPVSRELEYGGALGVKVAFDKQSGLPVKYILEDGKEVGFDMAEMKRLHEKAIASHEPEIAAMILLDNAQEDFKKYPPLQNYSTEHPKVVDLPADVLSEKELSDRGVTILQPGDQNTTLFIRKGAFEKGELLADFNKTGRNLTIILLEGSTIDSKYLNNPKYAQLIKDLRSFFPLEHYFYPPAERKRFLIKNIEANLNGIRQAIDDLRKSNQPIDPLYEEFILKQKQLLYKYQNVLTDEQVDQEPIDASGFYIPSKDNPIIVLSLGGHTYNYLSVYLTPKEMVADVRVETALSMPSPLHPQPRHTYPNPQDILVNPYASPNNPRSYPYGSNFNPGIVLGHELSHDELIQQAVNKGNQPNHREYDTDIRAMKRIKNAWDKWIISGDNSGYYFVFSLPEEGRGYILTKHIDSKFEGKPTA